MDNFINLAKEGFQAYQAAQAHHGQAPQQDYQDDDNSQGYQPPSGAPPSRPPPHTGGGANQEYYNQSSGGAQSHQYGGQGGGGGYVAPQGPPSGQEYGGGQGYNQGNQSGPGYGGGGQGGLTPGNDVYNHPGNQIDQQYAAQAASAHAGPGHDPQMFQNAIHHIQSGPPSTPSYDHQSVQEAHEEAYGAGNPGNLPASGMGAAAAMQAFKMFTGGGGAAGGARPGGGPGAEGNPQSQILAMAMAEASKLFDQQGGAASGNKQEAITSAAKMAMKLLMQSKMGAGASGGAAPGGGLGSMLQMASKFM